MGKDKMKTIEDTLKLMGFYLLKVNHHVRNINDTLHHWHNLKGEILNTELNLIDKQAHSFIYTKVKKLIVWEHVFQTPSSGYDLICWVEEDLIDRLCLRVEDSCSKEHIKETSDLRSKSCFDAVKFEKALKDLNEDWHEHSSVRVIVLQRLLSYELDGFIFWHIEILQSCDDKSKNGIAIHLCKSFIMLYWCIHQT